MRIAISLLLLMSFTALTTIGCGDEAEPTSSDSSSQPKQLSPRTWNALHKELQVGYRLFAELSKPQGKDSDVIQQNIATAINSAKQQCAALPKQTEQEKTITEYCQHATEGIRLSFEQSLCTRHINPVACILGITEEQIVNENNVIEVNRLLASYVGPGSCQQTFIIGEKLASGDKADAQQLKAAVTEQDGQKIQTALTAQKTTPAESKQGVQEIKNVLTCRPPEVKADKRLEVQARELIQSARQ